jgi:hypothetical protein
MSQRPVTSAKEKTTEMQNLRKHNNRSDLSISQGVLPIKKGGETVNYGRPSSCSKDVMM